MHEKYLYLPEKYHKTHDICFSLIKQIEEFITNENYQELKSQSVNLTEDEAQKLIDSEITDVLNFLLTIGKKDEFNRIIRNTTIHGLIIDNCYFLQEALSCSTKRRLVVTFSLLRRPFIYNMVIILRLLLEDNFLDKYISGVNLDSEKGGDFDAAKIPKDILDLLQQTDGHLIMNNIGSSFVYEYLFDRTNSESLINLSEKALHPVTTRNAANKTGAMNLNFVFSTPVEYELQWDYLYRILPPLLLFYIDLVDTLVFSHLDREDNDKLIADRLIQRVAIIQDLMPSNNDSTF